MECAGVWEEGEAVEVTSGIARKIAGANIKV
jgi:hypothetical protein